MTKFGVPPGSDGGPQPFDHLPRRHHGLAVQVTAALRVYLVLEVAAGQAGVLEHGHGARGVHRLAEAGVGVDQAWAGRSTGRDLRTARG